MRASELPSKVNQDQAQDPYSAPTSQRYGLQICIEIEDISLERLTHKSRLEQTLIKNESLSDFSKAPITSYSKPCDTISAYSTWRMEI